MQAGGGEHSIVVTATRRIARDHSLPPTAIIAAAKSRLEAALAGEQRCRAAGCHRGFQRVLREPRTSPRTQLGWTVMRPVTRILYSFSVSVQL